MQYENNESKFIAVINPKIELPKLMNSLGHITAGLIAKTKNITDKKFLEYEFQVDWAEPSFISLYPFIILKAKNNNQIKTLHQAANEERILHNVFTESMLGDSAMEQIEKTKNTQIDNLIYFSIVLFGSTEKLTPLTRKFSLFKT